MYNKGPQKSTGVCGIKHLFHKVAAIHKEVSTRLASSSEASARGLQKQSNESVRGREKNWDGMNAKYVLC